MLTIAFIFLRMFFIVSTNELLQTVTLPSRSLWCCEKWRPPAACPGEDPQVLRGKTHFKEAFHQKKKLSASSAVIVIIPKITKTDSTCFLCCESQDVAGLAHAHAVGNKHAEVVGLGRTQIHQGHLGQLRIWELSPFCSIPGCCAA